VSPFEVERVLNEHPAVSESAVAGISIGGDKTITAAFVVLKERVDSEEIRDGLINYAQNRLARYKCPREIVLVDSIPKTTNGKIKRNVLRETYSIL
jgi:acyl-coenzyme A synthetase/AMP-(fatty) acid ligase